MYSSLYLATLGNVLDDVIRDALAHCKISVVQTEAERWERSLRLVIRSFIICCCGRAHLHTVIKGITNKALGIIIINQQERASLCNVH